VNDITEKIAQLNIAILQAEVSGDTANDYRDQRNLLVDRLSKLVDADVIEMQDGQLSITVGGYFLVYQGKQTRLYAGEGEPGTIFNVPKLEGTDIVVPIKNGIIKGLLESRGEVSGAKGSYENGTPMTKVDIVFAFDVSQGSDLAYLNRLTSPVDPPNDMETPIEKFINDLNKRGVDYNLTLVTFGGTASLEGNFGNDAAAFISAVNSLAETGDVSNNFGEAGGLVPLLTSMSDFRPDAVKHVVVFTHESIGGNEGADIDAATAKGYLDALNNAGIWTSVVTDTSYFETGFGSETVGWKSISKNLHDIDSLDISGLMVKISEDIKTSVNRETSVIEQTGNIISDLKRRLNALINVLAREVNYLHRNGKTLGNPPMDGLDFFVPINDDYPIEMGNIMLNPIFADDRGLNYIAASATGASGDNTIALMIANLRHQTVLADFEGVLNMDEYYQSIILHIGHSGSDAERISENQQKLVQSADSYRQSITGVSMDEEMSNMMKYKFAYKASSRVINVIDEMIETIILRMGLAGR